MYSVEQQENQRRNIMKIFLTLILSVLATALFFPNTASSQFADIPEIEHSFLEQDVFDGMTHIVSGSPFGIKELKYSINLPKDWSTKIEPPQPNTDNQNEFSGIGSYLLQDLAAYTSPPKLDTVSKLSIRAKRLDQQIDARNWFVNFAIEQTLIIQAMTVISENKIDVQYIEYSDNVSYQSYTRVQINGPYIILVEFKTPSEFYEQEKSLQAQIVHSFTLDHIVEEDEERMETYHFLDVAKFQYPSVWKLTSQDIPSSARMEVSLTNYSASKNASGQVKIYAIQKAEDISLDKEVARMVRELQGNQLKIKAFIESKNYLTSPSILKSKTEAYELESHERRIIDYEIWISTMESEDYIFLIRMITLPRDQNLYNWSENIKGYQIIVESLTSSLAVNNE